MLKWLSIAFPKCNREITDKCFFHGGVICLEILIKKKAPKMGSV